MKPITGLVALVMLAAPLPAAAQTWRVDRQINKDFPNQRKEVVRPYEVNGLKVFHLKIIGNRGESTVHITETGDYLTKSVPTRLGGMPDNVMAVLKPLFKVAPESAQYQEKTTYTVDLGAYRPVRVEFDSAGRIQDIISGAQLRAQEGHGLPGVDRRTAHEVAHKIETYFENAKIKQIYTYPDAPGFYFAELTGERETRKIDIVMDTRKDVPFWRYELRAHEMPRPVQRALSDLFPNAKITRIMRVKTSWYRVEQPVGEDKLHIDIRPTGDVVRVYGGFTGDYDGNWRDRDRGNGRGDRFTDGWDRPGDNDRERPPVRGRGDRY